MLFRARAKPKEGITIDDLSGLKLEISKNDEAVGEIFETISEEGREKAAGKTFAYLEQGGSSDLVFAADDLPQGKS